MDYDGACVLLTITRFKLISKAAVFDACGRSGETRTEKYTNTIYIYIEREMIELKVNWGTAKVVSSRESISHM